MQLLQKLALTTAVVTVATVGTVTSAHATTYQRQWQSVSTSASSSTECTGSCSSKSESSVSVEQHQSQGDGRLANWGAARGHRDWDEEAETNTTGEVKISWSMRDGTCYIQYRMAGQAGWPYSTQADCNEGSKTIGGLQEGKNYQFRVKKNDGRWTRPMTRRAE